MHLAVMVWLKASGQYRSLLRTFGFDMQKIKTKIHIYEVLHIFAEKVHLSELITDVFYDWLEIHIYALTQFILCSV